MRILAELDAILDTRLPVVATIDPEAAARLVVSPAYYLRQIDDFSEITQIPHEQYLKAFKGRNDEHVQGSRITNIVLRIRELTHHLQELNMHEPIATSVTVDVNVFPYRLDEFGTEICNAVAAPCAPGTLVNLVRLSPDELSPSFIKKNYTAMFVYNFDEWFSRNMKQLEQIQMPTVTVFAPALYRQPLPELDDEDKEHLQDRDPFELIEETHVFFLRLVFLDAKEFSILQYWELPEKIAAELQTDT